MADIPHSPQPNANNISIWDFILFNQVGELQNYINMLQSKDDNTVDDKDLLCQKVLDSRVESSVRFLFQNPIVGQHGYTHVSLAKSPSRYAEVVVVKGSTPLHYAVHLRHDACISVLLEAGADASIIDELHQTPYRLARIVKDDKIAASFQQFRPYGCKLRKQYRLAVVEVESSRKKLAQFQADVAVLTQVRATLMAQVVALWWRYTTSIIRRQNVMATKHQLASQLENLMQVSSATISNLEKEKRVLLDDKSLLQEQVTSLLSNKNTLENLLAESKTKLTETEKELGDRNAMKADLNAMRAQLKSSVELISATMEQHQLLAVKNDGSIGFEPQKLLGELKATNAHYAQLQLESVKDKADLASALASLNQAKSTEVSLRADLEAASKRLSDYKLEISALRVAANAVSMNISSSVTAADVHQHPDFIRMQKQLDASRKEIERLRSIELQLRGSEHK